MTDALTVGSLFAGIGGFDLGLERAGMRSVWQSEIDPYCQRVLARHWPDVLRVPDVRNVGADTVPYVDVICGGFPCQDISVAGRGEGIDGARSGLWSEYARVVGELRPRYVVVENVAALLARGLGTVLRDLAALGYDAEWDCLPASAFGAPHRRDRLWLVAYPGGARRREDPGSASSDEGADEGRAAKHDHVTERDGEGHRTGDVADANQERRDGELRTRRRNELEDGGGMGDPEGNGRRSGQGRPDPAGEGEREPVGTLQDPDSSALQPWRVGGRAAQAGGPEWWAVEPPIRRVAHGVPNRLDQLAALGNALVPQIAEWIGERIVSYEARVLAA